MRGRRGQIGKQFTYRFASHDHLRKSDRQCLAGRAFGGFLFSSCLATPPFSKLYATV